MGFIGGIFSGDKGAGFGAGGTNILQPTTTKQAQDAYAQAQSALGQQQNFVNAVNAQNGLGNQSQVYNQLQGVVNGTGPNPAQAQLAQATSANTANQAALMAGQRGSSSNPALIARQAAQQGAANQQNAAGQAATLQAQQSLGALGQAGSMANQQAGQQAQAVGALNQFGQNEQNQLLNSINAQNQANVAMQSNINNANAGIAAGNQQAQGSTLGGVLGGIGSVFGLAHGGEVPTKMADGGEVSGPQSYVGKFLNGYGDATKPTTNTAANPMYNAGVGIDKAIGAGVKGIAGLLAPTKGIGGATQPLPTTNVGQNMMAAMAKGGKVKAIVSPGELYLPPEKAKKVADGKENPMKAGKKIPGKAKVSGDSYENDTVPRELKSGGIVVPRSVMQSKDPAKAAAKFVAAHLSMQKRKK